MVERANSLSRKNLKLLIRRANGQFTHACKSTTWFGRNQPKNTAQNHNEKIAESHRSIAKWTLCFCYSRFHYGWHPSVVFGKIELTSVARIVLGTTLHIYHRRKKTSWNWSNAKVTEPLYPEDSLKLQDSPCSTCNYPHKSKICFAHWNRNYTTSSWPRSTLLFHN